VAVPAIALEFAKSFAGCGNRAIKRHLRVRSQKGDFVAVDASCSICSPPRAIAHEGDDDD
jgi:hypothetical protein